MAGQARRAGEERGTRGRLAIHADQTSAKKSDPLETAAEAPGKQNVGSREERVRAGVAGAEGYSERC